MLIVLTAQIAATKPVSPGPAAKLTLPLGSDTPTATVNDMRPTDFGSFTSADEVHDVEENQEDPDRAKINRDGAAAEAAIANHPEISKIPHVLGGVGIEEVLDEHQRYAGLQLVVYVFDQRNVKAVRRAVPKYLEGFPVVVRKVPIIKHLDGIYSVNLPNNKNQIRIRQFPGVGRPAVARRSLSLL